MRHLVPGCTGHNVVAFGEVTVEGTAHLFDINSVDVPHVCDWDVICDLEKALELEGS